MSRRQLSAIQQTSAFEREQYTPADQPGTSGRSRVSVWDIVIAPGSPDIHLRLTFSAFFAGPNREAEKERLYDTLAFGREAAAAKAVRRLAAFLMQ